MTLRGASLDSAVIASRDSDEHTRPGSGKPFRRLARVFHRLVSDFQQHAVLRIDASSLPRGNTEEIRIELVYLIDKAAPSGGYFTGFRRIRIVKAAKVPSISWNLSNRI